MTRLCAALLLSPHLSSAQAATTCPPAIDGHPLLYAEVYSGPPGLDDPQRPEIGGWRSNPLPSKDWGRFPAFTLACRHRDKPDIVVVAIPRTARVCAVTPNGNAVCS